MSNSRLTNEAQVRALIEARGRAVRAKDLGGAVTANAPDVVTYDALPPLYNTGAETIRERTERWLGSYPDALGYDVRDLTVSAGGDVAFAHYLYRVSGTLASGDAVNMWVRATLGLHKLGGEWKIVHEHNSVPFDPQSGQASLGLEP